MGATQRPLVQRIGPGCVATTARFLTTNNFGCVVKSHRPVGAM
jgi:hypothetical protein